MREKRGKEKAMQEALKLCMQAIQSISNNFFLSLTFVSYEKIYIACSLISCFPGVKSRMAAEDNHRGYATKCCTLLTSISKVLLRVST